MKLRNIFGAVTVPLVPIAIGAPADAQLKCKAKQDKKTEEMRRSGLLMIGLVGFFLAMAGPSFAQPFSISGQVYLDADVSQSFTGGDSGIDGVSVVLYDVSANSCQSVATSGGGLYSFAGLAAGDYRVYEAAGETVGALSACPPTESTADLVSLLVIPGTIQDPAGLMSTSPNRIDLTLAADAANQDFGDYALGASEECSDTAYLFQQDPSEIWEIDLVTGNATNTGVILGSFVNGFGFNPLDGYFWGSDMTASIPAGTPSMLGAVAADGGYIALECLNCAPEATARFNAGDISHEGYLMMWSTGSANQDQICWFDVNPQRATYLQRVDSVTRQPSASCTPVADTLAADFGINPVDNLVYAARNSSRTLYQVDPVSGAFTTYTNVLPAACIPGWGAQFFDADGFLYVSCNSTGAIHRVDLSSPPAFGAPHSFDVVFFSSGPASSNNDGGRCALAVTALDFGDAPSSYATTLADDGPRHTVVPNLFLGALIDNESDAPPTEDTGGDDSTGSDDEDGLLGNFAWSTDGSTLGVDVSVVNTTGTTAYVGCYVDFDEGGTFDTVDEYAEATAAASGTVTLTWTAPVGQVNNPPFARCRVSTDQAAVQSPTGPAVDGEVEDHALSFGKRPICGDSVVDPPSESCDDGGESATCDSDCSAVSCGDSVTNTT
ncbi:MAG: GEVED domain-containing protein, partial [bacterium]